MAYTVKNYKTKKELLVDFKAGVKIECFQPGGMFPLKEGRNTLEGPHYPKPHKWYASCVIVNNYATEIK
jgi:hypothetical protein